MYIFHGIFLAQIKLLPNSHHLSMFWCIKLEGCPVYQHRVESCIVGIDWSHRNSSGERLRVKYTKDMEWGRKSPRLDSTPLESSRLVLLIVDSTYWKSSGGTSAVLSDDSS